mmetsp:Transcript_52010/g.62572  ORF Transcript_52010/g.62572 Transcript_52010/m.62572 type:complete len:472 (+) Transcript_52010:115-1530(+)|eukprot:CAMPEP_0172514292 /NCGR_PEP_ID=MMETSP1066-20121228/258951_1 /TAXON_ID=671091 /ORGANISM="Coscinodiscus wailesii, Strain CCMP2513" /LENGTH=471 /DNA_ID=CAMNT_0013294897 /DNA_START=94 /DNA_END=1509 /DNA_ORIENTATION=+
MAIQRERQQQHHHHHHLPCELGNQWSQKYFGEGAYPFVVTSSVITYWTVVSIIPLYNKYFFDKTMFPYPIATAGIQLGVTALLLMVVNTAQHFWTISECLMSGKFQKCARALHSHENSKMPKTVSSATNDRQQQQQQEQKPQSWMFGPHLLWKLKWCSPIGMLFGLKYGVTNLGLHLVPAPTHLLLQSTDMVWTLLGAWIINKEHVTSVGLCCVFGCVAGSAVLSIRIGQTVTAPLPAIAVNLLSPVLLGLCITTLRRACTELMRGENRVGGSVSSFELSALKLTISAPVALLLACMLEQEKMVDGILRPSWQDAFAALPLSTKLGVIGGALLILVFQVNCTFLAFLTSAVDVGLVGQVKIIPQWITAALFFDRTNLHITELNGIGAFITMTSAAVFVFYDWLSVKYPDTYGGASFIEDCDDVILDELRDETKFLLDDSIEKGEDYSSLLIEDIKMTMLTEEEEEKKREML